ncbi:hypothetical protein D3874_21810 [Oleomonas cavernae]|uniref:Acetoacetate decarboxylase n=1 Tax=Oleomonas cavernae TaxID=2320859 RepID=A0A418WGW9_9PROT|nr:acetoacetate decarboxylase family protein [Oleomonas cavernae]RJF89281.1 hypothetical protein D3874_21810 [Oleomonas cavernae]
MPYDENFFAEADANTTLCRISDGSDVEMPLKTYEAEALSAVFTVDVDAARKLIPVQDLKLCRVSPDRALAALQFMDYRGKNIDRYQEVVVLLFVHKSPLVDIAPVSTFFTESLPGMGYFIVHIGVSGDQARRVGWDILGFPKFLAEISVVGDEQQVSGKAHKAGKSIFSLDIQKPPGYADQRQDFSCYTIDPDSNRLYTIPYQYWASRGLVEGASSATLTLGDHEIADEIRALGLSEEALFAQHVPNYALISNFPSERRSIGDWRDTRGVYREVALAKAGKLRGPAEYVVLDAPLPVAAGAET